ncbi:MAG: divalent-cation tolerance protein CutA [Azospirillaceae bacterium]|nr:divalent-cation tolerance protein CutA [Azospirillaceae bacterium]
MDAIMIYVTATSKGEAEMIGRTLVTERLAACANIIDGMRSIYHWQGAVEQADEVVVLIKTRRSLFDVVQARVRVLHSAVTPCIVALPLVAADPDYLAWIAAETA